ncbi:MAG: hypothetical protein A2600_04950 [Candidatus Lambdaproteobacteria bacterium RIFOXYD1_FULL_56_27]|uniref:Uncharacterized protein n=1 Tax=Candidatus Lambdaproteobacteria bacterium RIFOXYD2_FULL_56_26 TaxID=1817773 RepID=A0A1F6GRV5_9PROT|nr:MAG: hypothetical protein A2426_07805 [Candidatus Lambdaproteobacteria bacterium RIFOXYC1_FULL_56_13]OGH00834.1 MAG: hypothetical protein A2557_03935 [Candidatus Lambdaproteobacteria bacterium RIFOXYD2_FULL_56_26]OGH09901.1 MAG: hypothetical protein A2600_04950 [Candidatus Lambdaproteobacteria bacterium RIFOXYD1_FULL_56_27]
MVVGAYHEDGLQNTATNAGAACVLNRSGTTWFQGAYLKASNAEANDTFGYRVGISSTTIVLGANMESSIQTTINNGSTAQTDNGSTHSGAASIYTGL